MPSPPMLTQREGQVLSGVMAGHSSKEIANELRLSPRTIEIYRVQLLKKFGVRNSLDLVRRCLLESGVADG